uniref:RIMS-binding protein 2-like n=1 Tax=Scleropages formosus TaxID=113540 RepID=A0A8C9VHT3_SCLFO
MREVAERRQQLEFEHEQALAILTFKQDEVKRLQRVSPQSQPAGRSIMCLLNKVIRPVSWLVFKIAIF